MMSICATLETIFTRIRPGYGSVDSVPLAQGLLAQFLPYTMLHYNDAEVVDVVALLLLLSLTRQNVHRTSIKLKTSATHQKL